MTNSPAPSLTRTLAATARLPFLILTPACVSLGVANAILSPAPVSWSALGVVLLGALAAHVGVNALNEYLDFRSGLDLQTERTPFSGGSGALPERPDAAPAALVLAFAALLVVVVSGVWLIVAQGAALLWVGIPGLAIILSYTSWLNRRPFLCLLAPGLAFGPLMVLGTELALTAATSFAAVFTTLPVFFVVNNLLLLNQFPDVEADAVVGRRHLAIAYGLNAAVGVYALFVLLAATALLVGAARGWLPVLALAALLPLLAGAFAARRAYRFVACAAPLQPALVANVVAAITLPMVLALALLVAG